MTDRRAIGTLCCPWHGETTPSLVIYNDDTFHCFGCGKTGTREYLERHGVKFDSDQNPGVASVAQR